MLTAYRVYLNNGTFYVTNMAEKVTLEDARNYFVGQLFELEEGKPLVKVIKVENVY